MVTGCPGPGCGSRQICGRVVTSKYLSLQCGYLGIDSTVGELGDICGRGIRLRLSAGLRILLCQPCTIGIFDSEGIVCGEDDLFTIADEIPDTQIADIAIFVLGLELPNQIGDNRVLLTDCDAHNSYSFARKY